VSRMNTTIVIAAVICAAISLPIHANSKGTIQLRNSIITSLLPEKTVVCVERDLTGFLWICTQQGLYKYDGYTLIKFSPLNRLKYQLNSFDVKQLFVGKTGNIFVATNGGGISRYNPVTENFIPLFENPDPNYLSVNSVVETPDGYLWFTALQGGIASYRPETGEFHDWLTRDKLNSAVTLPSDIIALPSGDIWFGAKKGLYRIRPELDQLELFLPPQGKIFDTRASNVRAIQIVSEEALIVGTKSGHLSHFNVTDEAFSKERLLSDLKFNSINDLALFGGKLWAATDLGLISIDQKSKATKRYSVQNSHLSNNDVHALSSDGGSLWVGTYFGIDFLFSSPFDIFNMRNSGVENEIMSFTEDSAKRLWIGTYNGMYFREEKSQHHKSITKLYPKVSISDDRIMSSSVIGDNLWLGLRGDGLQIVNLADGTNVKPKVGLDSNVAVTKILHTQNGETWVGTHKSGLYRFREMKLIAHYGLDILSQYFGLEDVVTTLFETKEGMILVGTEHGLLEIDPKTNVFSQEKIGIEPNTLAPIILSVTQDRKGKVWVGTLNQGIFLRDKIRGLVRSEFHSLIPGVTAYAIVIDDQGNSWVSTTQGLLQISNEGIVQKKYTVAHGLQDNDFNFGASYKDSRGRIYFGGSNGYNRFFPSKVKANSPAPSVVFTNLNIIGETPSLPSSLQELEKFQLSHNDYFFTISFSVLDFLEPSKNQYSYKLDNFDAEWIDNGTSNSATYTNLPPGNYTFRVRGSNSAGVWNLEGASIEVEVLPAPWFSWWALVCYALAIITAVFCGKKIYDDRLIARKVAIRAEQMQHAADRASDDLQERLEIQDELVRSVYKHNLDTLDLVKNLNAVRAEFLTSPVEIHSFEKDQQRLAALSCLESCVLYQDEILYADLKKYTDRAIDLTLKSSSIPVESITTINDVSSKMVPIELATSLAMVIFELLDNCVSHAFEPGSPANYIQISLDSQFNTGSQAHQISLVVKDDGVGFSADIPREELESTGLAFVRSVIEKFHGELTLSKANPGTRVEVLFPNTPELIAPYGNRS
jgi:ligand-binding sensor domain-containing protein/two-component sensor histidine kinase